MKPYPYQGKIEPQKLEVPDNLTRMVQNWVADYCTRHRDLTEFLEEMDKLVVLYVDRSVENGMISAGQRTQDY